ncbi:MAG TPA: discoidin domain-containing protein [Kofleriaceae bacterium]|nr:discoidin domain-containing protein [Kofleriaceae bacterium]
MNPSPPNLRALARPLLVAGVTTAVVFAAGLVSGHTLFAHRAAGAPGSAPVSRPDADLGAPPPARADACGLPAGITIDALSPADRAFALRRGFLCADHADGRLSADDYRTRVLQLELAHPIALDLVTPSAPADDITWASVVRAYSSQYTDSDWSAARALGPPDVPSGGDDPNAWAPEGADDRVEFIEVGFARPRPVRGVEIVENHNPGAVTRVELIATDGTRTVVHSADPTPGLAAPHRRRIDLACTARPSAAVRVTRDSTAVPDWNEIDAIGLRPCSP